MYGLGDLTRYLHLRRSGSLANEEPQANPRAFCDHVLGKFLTCVFPGVLKGLRRHQAGNSVSNHDDFVKHVLPAYGVCLSSIEQVPAPLEVLDCDSQKMCQAHACSHVGATRICTLATGPTHWAEPFGVWENPRAGQTDSEAIPTCTNV